MTGDEIDVAAQQIHNARHRAGTATTCGPCRDEAAGTPRRTLLDRVLYPARPSRVGYALFGVVLALAAVYVLTGLTAPWWAGWLVFIAQAWFLTGPPQHRSQIPTK